MVYLPDTAYMPWDKFLLFGINFKRELIKICAKVERIEHNIPPFLLICFKILYTSGMLFVKRC